MSLNEDVGVSFTSKNEQLHHQSEATLDAL